MEKLDRLGWAAGLSVSSYGVRIGVRTNDPAVLPRVQSVLPPCSRPSPARLVDRLVSLTVGGPDPRRNLRRFHLLYADSQQLSRTRDLDELLAVLETHLKLYVAERARRRVFVHAGVVGWRGRALLLPGSSHAGKSTLVTELVRRGARYYSDEYAVLDASGRVHPYARDPQVKVGGGRSVSLPLSELGGRPGREALPVGLVALARYQDGSRWRPRLISAGPGALEVLAHTVPARLRPEAALAALHRVVNRAPVWKGTRGEAAEAAAWLLEARERGGKRA